MHTHAQLTSALSLRCSSAQAPCGLTQANQSPGQATCPDDDLYVMSACVCVCVCVQVIGDVGMDKSATARHQHSARARDTVTVVKLTEESVLKAIMQQVMEGKEGATPADLLATTEADPVYSSRVSECW